MPRLINVYLSVLSKLLEARKAWSKSAKGPRAREKADGLLRFGQNLDVLSWYLFTCNAKEAKCDTVSARGSGMV